MNNKLMVALCVATVSIGAFAGPHGRPGPGHRPAPVRRRAAPPPIHHHKHSVWGRGGSNFWPGFVGGFVGGVVGGAVVEATAGPRVVQETVVVHQPVTTTTVVTTPVVVRETAPVVVTQTTTTETQKVWIEGRYVDQVQDNGTVVRVWQPGHYEVRTVVY